MPVFPLVGLNEHGFAGRDFAPSFRVFDHGKSRSVLDTRRGVLAFQLDDDGSREPGRHTVSTAPTECGDQFSNIRGYARHDNLLFPGAMCPDLSKFRGWCSLSGKKIERAPRALQHRGWHQDGVSDIDACK